MVSPLSGGPYRIIDALNADWDDLRECHQHKVRDWAARHRSLSDCATLTDVLEAVPRDPDGALLALLSASAGGDELAGRVVLQAMLGKVVRMAARDVTATADDYVAVMWCLIPTYPLTQRPVRVAANLALDTLKGVRRETVFAARGSAVHVVHGELLTELHHIARSRETLDHNAATTLTADSLIDAASKLGLIDGPTRQVLVSVYADGLSGRAAADRHQTSPEMIRYRCSRAVRRLAQHSTLLAEAA